MAAFEKKWPKPKSTKHDQDVVVEELMGNYLDQDTLGKQVKDEDGTSVLSHVAWVEVTQRLLGELTGGDAAMMLKSAIHAMLPVEFCTLINDDGTLDTWEKYLKAVESISNDRIKDAAEACTNRNAAMDHQAAGLARMNPARMPAALRGEGLMTQLLQLMKGQGFTPDNMAAYGRSPGSIQAARALHHRIHCAPVGQRTQEDIFGGSTLRPTTSFAKNLMTTPSSPMPAGSPVHLPSRSTGVQNYTKELGIWTTQNGPGVTPNYTTFPLAPSTVAAGSKECFRCGVFTNPPHYGRAACEAHGGQNLSQKEQNLRTWVGETLYPRSSRTLGHISQINEALYDPLSGRGLDEPLYEEEQSENGEESTVLRVV
ncbi:hypothetical protein B0H10DRAFT_2229862 [Mycena sp. CBHHK59/15]|nr:hypothetical protein B0H10DRAFT_2229862 [Mycena sp. CBHHK59/15]